MTSLSGTMWGRRGPAALVFMALACSQPAPAKEPESCKLQIVKLTVLASPRINLGETEARPVQLRIYQLSTDIRINNASFQDVWKDEKAALKEDLIKSEELSVYPDSRTDIEFERDEKAMVIAAVALFRTPKGRSWYTTFELPPSPGKGSCGLSLGGGGGAGGGAGAAAEEKPDGGTAAPKSNPHFVVWIDGTKVDDGSDRLADYPRTGREVQVRLPFAEPASTGSATTSAR
jgi:type VI secretion system protein VasD